MPPGVIRTLPPHGDPGKHLNLNLKIYDTTFMADESGTGQMRPQTDAGSQLHSAGSRVPSLSTACKMRLQVSGSGRWALSAGCWLGARAGAAVAFHNQDVRQTPDAALQNLACQNSRACVWQACQAGRHATLPAVPPLPRAQRWAAHAWACCPPAACPPPSPSTQGAPLRQRPAARPHLRSPITWAKLGRASRSWCQHRSISAR